MGESSTAARAAKATNDADRSPTSAPKLIAWKRHHPRPVFSTRRPEEFTAAPISIARRIDTAYVLTSAPEPNNSQELNSLTDEHLRTVLSLALSSPKLPNILTPAFERFVSEIVDPDLPLADQADRAADIIGQAVADGLAVTFGHAAAPLLDEEARLRALPAKGELPTWDEREKTGHGHLDALQFYETVWGPYRGRIYLDELNARDDKISRRVRTLLSRHPELGTARDILPPPGHVRTARLAAQVTTDHLKAVKRMRGRSHSALWRSTRGNEHR